jgi:hypothetical protein
MSPRIFIENPPPFKHAPRGEGHALVDVSIAEGVEITRQYLNAGLHITGFHHADLDRYEALQLRHEIPPERYDSFEYAQVLRQSLDSLAIELAPHRVVVYQTPEQQAPYFQRLVEYGIRHVVLVGKPFSKPPDSMVYHSTVEEVLAYLSHKFPGSQLRLGVIGIHLRRGEPARIANKFEAAGGKLRVMGQFIDDTQAMTSFMDALVMEFENRKLSFAGLEWNMGLAILSLENRAFYAKLLRKDHLACEDRFRGLRTIDQRIAESIRMDLEFAEQVKKKGEKIGLDIGYSIQPIIERYLDGRIHPAISGAVELARCLEQL